jgi:hypothetical protein
MLHLEDPRPDPWRPSKPLDPPPEPLRPRPDPQRKVASGGDCGRGHGARE